MQEVSVLPKVKSREWILNFQKSLNSLKGKIGLKGYEALQEVYVGDEAKLNDRCPLKHSFVDGIYVREIFIPKDTAIAGEIHKHAHPNFLLKGKVLVVTESGGTELLEAPLNMISIAGTKRAVMTIEDCVWVTIHHNPTNTQDLKRLEKIVTANNYDDYDKFQKFQNRPVVKLYNKLKSYL